MFIARCFNITYVHFVVFETEESGKNFWVVYFDTDFDGDLSDEKPLRNYRRNNDSFFIPNENGLPSFTMGLNIFPEKETVTFIFDDGGHGTHCAGIAGAVTNNNIGIAGVCWNCKIMNVKIGFENNTEAILPAAMGVQYAADNGAHVISMSWGDYTHYQVLEDAINYAYDKGAVLLAAAGNDEDDIPNDYPPAFENVIAVASTNNWDQRAIFSNHGNIIDIAAPGQNIYSTMPTYEVYFNTVLGFEMNYDYMMGNSMATPCVAGLAGFGLPKRDGRAFGFSGIFISPVMGNFGLVEDLPPKPKSPFPFVDGVL